MTWLARTPRRGGRSLARPAVLSWAALCSGCASKDLWLLHPQGPLADASLRALIVDTAATLLVIGPATILTLWAIWRYRRATGKGRYVPGWSHSVPIELLCWGGPFLVVVGLGYFSLQMALATDPAAPGVMAEGAGPDNSKPPINIDVITTDWQWLFIYRGRGIAVANKLVLPVHTPVRFRMTSATVATDFFIPQLVGQMDVMPGMVTGQGLIANQVGTYEGFATDFNGPGFAWMRFQTQVVLPDEFDAWVAAAGKSQQHLDDAVFRQFATPTINDSNTTITFAVADEGLFDKVMQDTMMSTTYPTPPNMTEKKAHKVNDSKQPTDPAAASTPDPDRPGDGMSPHAMPMHGMSPNQEAH